MAAGPFPLCELSTLTIQKQVKADQDVISYEWLRRCAELQQGTGVSPAEYLHLSAATRAAKSDVMDRYGCPYERSQRPSIACCPCLPMPLWLLYLAQHDSLPLEVSSTRPPVWQRLSHACPRRQLRSASCARQASASLLPR